MEVKDKMRKIKTNQEKKQKENDKKRINIGQSLFAQIMGGAEKPPEAAQQVFEDSIAPAKVETFGKEADDNNSDSDFTEEIERDDDDSELFNASSKNAEIEKSTGTFGKKNGLYEQFQ